MEISFNPCAPTLIKNALKRAHYLIEKRTDLFKIPNAETITAIIATANGDLKSAINQYYFASLLNCSEVPTVTLKKSTTKRKRNEKNIEVMSRDEKLGLFHGIGRVLNPKRIDHSNTWRLHCDLNKLIDEFSIQPQNCTNFLFENYLKYFGDINDVCGGIEALSLGQTFMEKWVDGKQLFMFGLWVAILGLMISNEHRVSKWNPIVGPKKIQRRVSQFPATELFYYNIINNFENKDFRV